MNIDLTDTQNNCASLHVPLFYLLALSRVTFLSTREKLLLLNIYDEPRAIFSLSIREKASSVDDGDIPFSE